jgi:5-amino-6-(5-phosphoribosylamino)uracil reductase
MALEWAQRFAVFADRKVHEAEEAVLPPYRTVTEQPPPGFEPLGNPWTRRLFDGDFYLSPERVDIPATSLVFVQSRDGNTGARNPATLGGGETDRHLIYEGLSRVAADGVLAGAETVRGGDVVFSVWHPRLVELREVMRLPRHPAQIVATLRGLPFDRTLLFNVRDIPVIVLTVHEWADRMRHELAERPWITTIEMDDSGDLRPALMRLRTLGLTRISCIGGRTIARALLHAGLIQDLYLTTAPRDGGDPNTPLSEQPLRTDAIVRKAGTGADDGVAFEHLVLRRSP